MTKTAKSKSAAASKAILAAAAINVGAFAPLSDFGLAPENPRFDEPADDGVPGLARTLVFKQVMPIITRPGGRGEKPHMTTEGRRRLFGWAYALEQGWIKPDHPVWYVEETDRAALLTSSYVANAERIGFDQVHTIRAIGAMRKAKLKTQVIADALGVTELDVQRLGVLADLPDQALDALRAKTITLSTAKLLTRVKDPTRLNDFCEQASRGVLYDSNVRHFLSAGIVSTNDPRFGLVSEGDYTAAGGRIERDLFDLVVPTVLDPDVLQRVWDEKTRPVIEAMQAAGVDLYRGAGNVYQHPPEGFDHLMGGGPTDDAGLNALAVAQADLQGLLDRATAAAAGEEAVIAPTPAELVLAQLAVDRAETPGAEILAGCISPDRHDQFAIVFFAKTSEAPEVEDDGVEVEAEALSADHEDDEETAHVGAVRRDVVEVPKVNVDTQGRTHALHDRYTDVATRGVAAELASNPAVAMNYLVARLFASMFLGQGYDNTAASRIKGVTYGSTRNSIEGLDRGLYETLDAQRAAYLESGLRPYAWVASLTHGERMLLLAQLTAATLDAREMQTWSNRSVARAEMIELVDALDYDITAIWTPDAAFFGAHSKKPLLQFITVMGGDVAQAAGMKKDPLTGYVTQLAADKLWAPDELSWRYPAPESAAAEEVVDDIDGAVTSDGANDDQVTVETEIAEPIAA